MNYERKTQGEANSGKSEHLTRLRLVGLLIQRTNSHYQMLPFSQTVISLPLIWISPRITQDG
jgi:hypothetical protein